MNQRQHFQLAVKLQQAYQYHSAILFSRMRH